MSYSRWSNSRWYTFWCVTESDKKEDQIFEICTVKSFTFLELKDNVSGCLDRVAAIEECSEADLLELQSYMLRFISDVEKEYA